MQEQLVSKETAILAKEKGFNEETYDYFSTSKNARQSDGRGSTKLC